MSLRHFDSTENAELRAKIDQARRLLPMPSLLRRLGYDEKHIGKTALCPFHSDEHPSFSVFQGDDGFWHWKCHAGCGDGDEIMFLSKLKGLLLTKAMNLYLEMAGFPARRLGSREYRELPEPLDSPKSLSFPESPCVSCVSVSPVSNGQGIDKELEKELKGLAASNACTRAGDRAQRKRFKLARDVRGFEVELGRKLDTPELVLYEWHRFSQPFLNPAETRDDHLAAFLAELAKVREPTSEADKLQKALENILKLLPDQLPTLSSVPEKFREKYRRLGALHREMSRLCEGKIYFISYRDAAKVCDDLSHQEAHTITYGLVTLGVIEIVSKGKAGVNSRKAAEFRYLLSQGENGAQEYNGGFDL
jgi:CHC2 zinc finger